MASPKMNEPTADTNNVADTKLTPYRKLIALIDTPRLWVIAFLVAPVLTAILYTLTGGSSYLAVVPLIILAAAYLTAVVLLGIENSKYQDD